MNDGDNATIGNNVDAHLDLNNSNPACNDAQAVRPNGGTNPDGSRRRLFDFDLDLGQAPTVNQSGAFNQSAAVVE
jgi:hypothetical protein